MIISAPISAARVPFRVNDREMPGGVPAVALQSAAERWPGRVFFFLPWGRSLAVLGARERNGRVEVLTGCGFGERAQWRVAPENQEEGYLYAR